MWPQRGHRKETKKTTGSKCNYGGSVDKEVIRNPGKQAEKKRLKATAASQQPNKRGEGLTYYVHPERNTPHVIQYCPVDMKEPEGYCSLTNPLNCCMIAI